MFVIVGHAIEIIPVQEILIDRFLYNPEDLVPPVFHDYAFVKDLCEWALPDVSQIQPKSITLTFDIFSFQTIFKPLNQLACPGSLSCLKFNDDKIFNIAAKRFMLYHHIIESSGTGQTDFTEYNQVVLCLKIMIGNVFKDGIIL